jgi:hypothetical protein
MLASVVFATSSWVVVRICAPLGPGGWIDESEGEPAVLDALVGRDGLLGRYYHGSL